MKDYAIIILIATIVALVWLDGCNDTVVTTPTVQLFERIDSLKPQYDSLKNYSDSLKLAFEDKRNFKDTLIFRYQSKYELYYDTISGTTKECLPKPYVDSLVITYEGLILDADTIIKVQSKQINNLELQNTTKDTIINIQTKEIKRQKKGKIKAFIGGLGIGTLFGLLLS